MENKKWRVLPENQCRILERERNGLTREGISHLHEMEKMLQDPDAVRDVDHKQLRYLREFRKMKLTVPMLFKAPVEPRAYYRHLSRFCVLHDIPDEIISRLVPSLLIYIETGHMRPLLFVGEKGCGKTTAVQMLFGEALQLPTKVIKIPQLNGGHGMTGDCGIYRSADLGELGKARVQAHSLILAYIFDEIDKVPQGKNGSLDDELLSVTDESNVHIYENYLETDLVGLNYCPMLFTANDIQNVNPILADRCTVIHFPDASRTRLKSILSKYTRKMLESPIYDLIAFNFEIMERYVDRLVDRGVTSIRRHQQLVEAVVADALDVALKQKTIQVQSVTEEMFQKAEDEVLGGVKRRIGF